MTFNLRDCRLAQRCKCDLRLFFWDCLTLEDGTDMLSRNVGKNLQICAA